MPLLSHAHIEYHLVLSQCNGYMAKLTFQTFAHDNRLNPYDSRCQKQKESIFMYNLLLNVIVKDQLVVDNLRVEIVLV